MKAHRAILIRLPRDRCNVDYIKRLTALTSLAYRGFEVWVPDLPKTIQNQLYGFRNFKGSLVFGTKPKGWFAETWVPLKTFRVYPDGSRKGDKRAPVVLDFRSSIIRIRQVCRNEPRYVVTIPMPKWVVDRLSEGGDIKFARVGLKDNEPHLALVAERVVEPYAPSGYILAVDVNSWKYGIAWGLVKGNRISSFKQEGLNVGKIVGLYKQAVRRERKLGALKRLGLGDTVNAKRAGRLVRRLRGRAYRLIRAEAVFLARKLIKKALRYRAMVVIDDVDWESLKELLTRRHGKKISKLILSGLKRFVKLLVTQLQWYGVPYEFKRLYSRKCPNCKLTQQKGRVMICTNCGFKAPRDMVPIYWVLTPSPP
ncbi:MAG: zinc ribbon domain-containing protein [Caldivirga sp.]